MEIYATFNEDEIPVGKAEDIRGKKFGRLTVLYRVADKRKGTFWKCKCNCGNITTVQSTLLKNGTTSSCGCLRHETASLHATQLNKEKIIDISGQRFGRLTVIKMVEKPKDILTKLGTGAWCLCKCDCGNEITTKANWLKTNGVQSCGCLHSKTSAQNGKNSAIDLTNKRFGKLIALYPLEQRVRSGSVVWHCKCDCGNEKDIASTDLIQNKTHSCGQCGYQSEMVSKDLLGQIFGRLTVVEKTNKRTSSGAIIWKCQCECGNIIEIPTNSLTSAHTMSCGCLQSKGEYNITKLLNKYQIPYEAQKKFDTCRFEDTNFQAKFDFYIKKDNYLIEYDGSQHFYANDNGGWNTSEKLQITQEHDKIKNQWCKENNIPLIRIPYTHLNSLCIEDLLLETTTFRVV